MKEYVELFWAFFRIGGLTFGGGYAMLPMIQKEVVEKHGWATDEEVMDYYAIGQCTPGLIAVNTATFVGYKTKGVLGGIIATAGVVAPSLFIIMLIASVLQNYAQLEVVQHIFGGIRVAVAVLVVNAIVKLWKKSVVDAWCIGIVLAAFILVAFLNLSPVYIVVGAALAGILLTRLKRGGRS